MSTATVGLQAAADLTPTGRIGIVFKQLPPGRFQQVHQDAIALIQVQDQSGAEGPGDGLRVEDHTDELGFDWLIVTGADFQGVLAAIHSVAQGLLDEGLGDNLLAAVFRFQQGSQRVYWIYGYKQATFYPFVPTGDHQRDNSSELRLAALAKAELPVEPQLERWFALWGVPV